MAKTKLITPQEYASLYGCAVSYINRLIRNNTAMPCVSKVNKHGRFYLLEVPSTISKEDLKKSQK